MVARSEKKPGVWESGRLAAKSPWTCGRRAPLEEDLAVPLNWGSS